MTDVVADIFGFGIIAMAIALAAWEIMSRRRTSSETVWLHTPSRLRRRILMAGLLVIVGLMMIAESRGLLELRQISHLVIYVSVLAGLAMALFVLSIRDLGDMARTAEQHAINDLQMAIEEKQKRENDSAGRRE